MANSTSKRITTITRAKPERAPRREVTDAEIDSWVTEAARAADDKKGERTIILRVGPVLTVTEYFVVTSAPNKRLVRTIADEVEQRVRAMGGPSPLSVEGLQDPSWVLLDYGDWLVHVFLEETREFYDLERLWTDVERLAWTPTPPVELAATAADA
jgi:ribosome-associated protein